MRCILCPCFSFILHSLTTVVKAHVKGPDRVLARHLNKNTIMIPAKRLKLMLKKPVKYRTHMYINMIIITFKGFFGWGSVWSTLIYNIGQTYHTIPSSGGSPEDKVWIKTWIKIVMLRAASLILSKNPSQRWFSPKTL